jgi:hypothetical protein
MDFKITITLELLQMDLKGEKAEPIKKETILASRISVGTKIN